MKPHPVPLFVAYYRVSTDRQGRSGLWLDAQREAVARYVERIGGEFAEAFLEVESGKWADRPELQKALDLCRRKKATLLIAKLDRLSRSVAFISNLMEAWVEFRAVDMPEASRLTIHILAAVAEHERAMISERTKAAMQQAKARGVKLGNPHLDNGEAARANVRAADEFAAKVYPIIEGMIAGGLSLRAMARELNERGIKTRTGKHWAASTVRNVILQRSNAR
jgi:DNA invertase Pin-like site-specific DNA recombinase